MQKFQDVVLNQNGEPVSGAVVLVTPSGTNSSTSIIFGDALGTSSRANPLSTDDNGRFWFYGSNSRFDLVVSGVYLQTSTIADIILEDVPLSNLAELSTASAARTNLGLGSAAQVGTAVFLQVTNNLSDISNAATARSNLGISAGVSTTATNAWTAGQRGTPVALAGTGQITPNLDLGNNFSLAIAANTTLAAASNVAGAVGQGGVITITQNATAKTLAFNTFWKFPGGSTGTLSTATGATDVLAYQIISTSAAACTMMNGFA